MGEVDVIETLSIKKKDYTAVLGLAGAGFIANTSTTFVARSKGWKQVAYVKSKHVPPMLLLVDGQLYQSFRIYIDDEANTLFVVTENLLSGESCYPLSIALLNWFKDKGVKEVLSLEGLPFSGLPDDVKALTWAFKYDASKLGYPQAREGAMSGLNAALLDECVSRGIPWVSIFIPTRQLTTIDYGGSAEAVDVLNNIFKYGVDSTPLHKSDEAFRKAVSQQQQQRSGIRNPFGRR